MENKNFVKQKRTRCERIRANELNIIKVCIITKVNFCNSSDELLDSFEIFPLFLRDSTKTVLSVHLQKILDRYDYCSDMDSNSFLFSFFEK